MFCCTPETTAWPTRRLVQAAWLSCKPVAKIKWELILFYQVNLIVCKSWSELPCILPWILPCIHTSAVVRSLMHLYLLPYQDYIFLNTLFCIIVSTGDTDAPCCMFFMLTLNFVNVFPLSGFYRRSAIMMLLEKYINLIYLFVNWSKIKKYLTLIIWRRLLLDALPYLPNNRALMFPWYRFVRRAG